MARGERLTELLKQPQYQPLPVEEQVVAIYAGVRGYLDKIAVGDVTRFQDGLLDAVRREGAEILQTIRSEGAISDKTEERLKAFVDNYARTFA